MRGLDARIHAVSQLRLLLRLVLLHALLDCRVKPGKDCGESGVRGKGKAQREPGIP
jgi:hypothetical protein